MLEHYEKIIHQIDELIEFLASIQIEAEFSSPLEHDYLIAYKFYEDYLENPERKNSDEGRIALGGLHELYKWVWSVKDNEGFEKLKGHLALLVRAAPRINAFTPMLNPVTKKQDDQTNKFIEAIVGFFAVKHGTNVDLDDPVHSSGGNNPDVIFDFKGKTVSIACKTLRSKKPQTVFENIKSATEQIEKAECDIGYILLNSMNILEHDLVQGKIFTNYGEPFDLLREGLEQIYREIISNSEEELNAVFANNPKVCPVVITTLHSATKIDSLLGILSTSLKGTIVTNFQKDGSYKEHDLELAHAFNEFIHNRYEPYANNPVQ